MHLLDLTRGALPSWVGWAALPAEMLLAFLLSLVTLRLMGGFALWRLRGAAGAHWSERARRLWPVRQVASLSILFLPVVLGYIAHLRRPALLAVPEAPYVLGVAAAALTGAVLGLASMERRLRDTAVTLRTVVGGRIVFLLLLHPHVLLAAVLALGMPSLEDRASLDEVQHLVLAWGSCLLLLLPLSAGGALPLLLLAGVLRPASPRLAACMLRAAEATGVHPGRVVEVRGMAANALAFPALRWVGVSRRALALLTDEELVAVCAHELGHLTESRWVTGLRVALGSLTSLFLAMLPLLSVFLEMTGILVALGALLVVLLATRRLLRREEARADRVGHAAGPQPVVYARALEKLHEANLLPATLRAREDVHPSLYDRMRAAGVEPAFPRPPPPPALGALLGLGVLGVWTYAAGQLGIGLMLGLGHPVEDTEPALVRAAAVAWDGEPLGRLAQLREAAGRAEDALALYEVAMGLDPVCAPHASRLARLHAQRGECEAALRALRRAQSFIDRCGEAALEPLRQARLATDAACGEATHQGSAGPP